MYKFILRFKLIYFFLSLKISHSNYLLIRRTKRKYIYTCNQEILCTYWYKCAVTRLSTFAYVFMVQNRLISTANLSVNYDHRLSHLSVWMCVFVLLLQSLLLMWSGSMPPLCEYESVQRAVSMRSCGLISIYGLDLFFVCL